MTKAVSRRRSDVVSSFTVIKGALIEETYAVLTAWSFERSKRENLDVIRKGNTIGAKSETWLRDVAWVVSRRLDPGGRDRPLALLAKAGMALDKWRPLLLWHITRDEFLLRDFLVNWLYPAWEGGAFRFNAEDLDDYLRAVPRRGRTAHAWTENTRQRVTAGLLKMAVAFGLLTGSVAKEFASYHLPDESFVYLLHAMLETLGNPARVIESPDWRLYLMPREDVERELLRLHQFRRLEYHVAGSLTQLKLPCATSLEFAATWVA